tara:strand:+ start:448 stop:1041 length:594 start_codon:yes stop_codon:yes gene_type:complete
MTEQTFWNKFMSDKTIGTFENWVGESDAESKRYFYQYIKNKNYKTLLDIGCGNATLYDGLQDNNIDINYTGADSCDYFVKLGRNRNLNILHTDIRKTDVNDSTYDIVFGRHIVEHQPDFETLFTEMIRIAKKESVHIFFIKPNMGDTIINYDKKQDLYHNTYGSLDIVNFLKAHVKVKDFKFLDINKKETMLVMNLL